MDGPWTVDQTGPDRIFRASVRSGPVQHARMLGPVRSRSRFLSHGPVRSGPVALGNSVHGPDWTESCPIMDNGTVLIIMLYIYYLHHLRSEWAVRAYGLPPYILLFIIYRFPPSAAPTHYTDRPMRIYVTATTPLLQRRTNATNALRERRTAAESLVWSAYPCPIDGTKLFRFLSCGDYTRIRI